MGFLDKILGRKDDASSTKPSPIEITKRAHDRFEVPQQGLVYVLLENQWTGHLLNISYGGLAVDITGIQAATSFPVQLQGKLIILDQSINCRFKVARQTTSPDGSIFLALTTIHETPDSLLFLRDFIEPLRVSTTLTAIDPSLLNQRFKATGWTCFRGEGPVDVMMKLGANNAGLEEALISFRHDQNYFEVRFKDGQLHTGKSSSPDHVIQVGALMTTTIGIDKNILRLGLTHLLGAPEDVRVVIKPLIEKLAPALGLEARVISAA